MTTGILYEPTDEQRGTVKVLSGFGVPQDAIAAYIEIDPKTMRKHFRVELDRGSLEAMAKVAQSLFNMATSGDNVAAAIFWMKARAGWREKNSLEVTGQNGAPIGGINVTFVRPGEINDSPAPRRTLPFE